MLFVVVINIPLQSTLIKCHLENYHNFIVISLQYKKDHEDVGFIEIFVEHFLWKNNNTNENTRCNFLLLLIMITLGNSVVLTKVFIVPLITYSSQ